MSEIEKIILRITDKFKIIEKNHYTFEFENHKFALHIIDNEIVLICRNKKEKGIFAYRTKYNLTNIKETEFKIMLYRLIISFYMKKIKKILT